MAKISGLPTTDKLTGAEYLPIVQGNATKRATMAALRDLITPFLQYWYKGDKGDTGAANSTYTTKAALVSAPITHGSYIFAPPNGEENGLAAGPFFFRSGDYRGLVDDRIIVALTGVPLDVGALVRQDAESLNFDGRSTDAKLRELASVRDARFAGGAKGNGVSDDTLAFLDLIARQEAGSRFIIPPGTYKLNRTVRLVKPFVIDGGAKEQVILDFAADGIYDEIGKSGQFACLQILHAETSNTVLDGRRTRVVGLTVKGNGAPNCHGVLINAPAVLDDVDSKGHSLSGFSTIADAFGAGSAPIPGNANGSLFTNCIGQNNGANGFYFLGDNANACVMLACKAPANAEYGLYDNSLLGNFPIAFEADANGVAGIWENPNKPIRNTTIGYSETPEHFSANPRSLRLNIQGLYKPRRSYGGTDIYPLASGDLMVSQHVTIAATDDIANTVGSAPFAGAAMRIGDEGLNFMPRANALRIQMHDLLSPENYTDIINGGAPLFRMPKRRVAGNIDPARQHMPDGFTLGSSGKSGVVGAGSAPPTSGSYDAGALWLNDAPSEGGFVGWVCITGGDPGVWRTFGSISNA
ncbi:MAG: hypothetical protein ACK4TC_05515 [Sphingomonas pseudosanguinis]|uniref:hypothetical protein n=1 Tax=Sphingomonas pseudosanguinis TaxID=413712 RepID=UPI00391BE02E